MGVWDEEHEIYGYIVDDTKRLEFNIWEATLLVKLHLPQAKFYPHGFEGALRYPGGKLDVKIEVTLPKTVRDAKDMVLSPSVKKREMQRSMRRWRIWSKNSKPFRRRSCPSPEFSSSTSSRRVRDDDHKVSAAAAKAARSSRS